MRVFLHIIVAYAVMLVGGTVWRLLPFDVVAPAVPAVFAMYLGVTLRDRRLTGAVLGAVVIGYLSDLVFGTPRGLMAVVAGTLCLFCRLVAARLLVRGSLVVAVFSFVVSLLASGLIVAIRLYLGAAPTSAGREIWAAVGTAAVTAVVAPLIVGLCRGVDAMFARTEREREALREGFLS
jgi:rod shape-determining protein MreD